MSRRTIVVASGSALIAIGTLVAGCGNSGDQPAPSTTTTTTETSTPPSSAVPLTPTEKSVNPTEGNLFTPQVKAPPAATVPPGQHPGLNGIP
jgi:hypothetical protein